MLVVSLAVANKKNSSSHQHKMLGLSSRSSTLVAFFAVARKNSSNSNKSRPVTTYATTL